MENLIRDLWPFAFLIMIGVLVFFVRGQIKLARQNAEREKREWYENSKLTGDWKK
jgi:hypothetical protein